MLGYGSVVGAFMCSSGSCVLCRVPACGVPTVGGPTVDLCGDPYSETVAMGEEPV